MIRWGGKKDDITHRIQEGISKDKIIRSGGTMSENRVHIVIPRKMSTVFPWLQARTKFSLVVRNRKVSCLY